MGVNKVLLVEDEFFVAVALEDVLQLAGYDVAIASTGDEAIDLLQSMNASLLALITDIRLPGASGWQVAEQARSQRNDLPVIYISGDSGVDWSTKGVGGSVFVQKPFRSDKLVFALQALVEAR